MILDNPLYAPLLGDAEMAALFSPEAEIAGMVEVERALARAQAKAGLVPVEAAAQIDDGLRDVVIAPQEISEGTAVAGVPVPPFVASLRKRLPKDAAHWLHWGATTHDIMDCALVLRMQSGFSLIGDRLDAVIDTLADLAEANADMPLAGRTRTQIATPISFGLRVAYWLQGLLDQRDALEAVRVQWRRVQFGGASGANSAVAPYGNAIIEALAEELGLVPAPPWHTARTPIPAATNWCAGTAGALARIAGDVLILSRREIAELRISGGGGSSTMPNKANPVSAEVIVALGRYAAGLSGSANLSLHHHEDRDSTAWMLEWLVLPQAMLCAGASLLKVQTMIANMAPDDEAMARNLGLDGGAAMAEAASFTLAEHMPRSAAQAEVKKAAMASRDGERSMTELLMEATGIEGLDSRIEELARAGSGREIIDQIVARARR